MAEIRLAKLSDLPAYREHLLRHSAENGRDGDVIFAPYEDPREISLEELGKEKSEKWPKLVLEVGWERVWVIVEDGRIRGELKLVHAPALATSLHRATLMMGIERSHRGQGWGSLLIETALAWARKQPTLDWIQLYVFENNEPAQKLYRKFGFREVGRMPDVFRVHGESIEDITMVLRVRD